MVSRLVQMMLIGMGISFAYSLPLYAADDKDPSAAEEPTRPTMTVTYAEIQGKVFLASARQGEEEEPASNVKVQVRDLKTNKVLREAVTDKAGYYSLPKLEPAKYLMIVGRLKLHLNVEPNQQPLTELPKILLIILPKEMTEFRE